ncbi:ORF48 [Plodia interpunctella granulovirus]|uniref:ORF48 n=1 Tax=Plodia interpunctella granulovirus TaxID=262175 RepID=A0A1L5JGL8_9BBAC|nr:ORF48 [Plodia interpunctella granulovirus]APO13932.1 ORF48 [Plodia interpunctella granulovirus]
MENFDQLDTVVFENYTLIQQVIFFVVSATLIFIICSLLYTVMIYKSTLEDQYEIINMRREELNKFLNEA